MNTNQIVEMIDRYTKQLLAKINAKPDGRVKYGDATADNTVMLDESSIAIELPYVVAVTTGDRVAVWVNGGDRLILGPVTQP